MKIKIGRFPNRECKFYDDEGNELDLRVRAIRIPEINVDTDELTVELDLIVDEIELDAETKVTRELMPDS